MSPEPMRDWDAFVVSSHLAFVPAVVVALVRFGKGYAWMLIIRNETYDYDILIFLDSDAWIQNWVSLNNVVNRLSNNNQKQGCFSRDPYLKKNTFINSGSFILKINDFTRKMYEYIMKDLYSNGNYHNRWPFDQYYISKYVFDNKDSFVIFVPDILNTPLGKILRHNWLKNKKMYDDLDKLKNEDTYSNTSSSALRARARARVAGYIGENDYCTKGFPNLSENGYDYFN
jgi:hypothetical protein